MKTLVIVAHPNLEASVINKRWTEALRKHPENYTVHDLYKAYPDGNIDVAKEQRLIETHGNLVFQFPIYWFNCPPLLKQWLDDVLTYGWAYGSTGDKLKGRKVALGVSAGIRKEDYGAAGKYRYTLEQLLAPFEATCLYCKADYRSFHAFYGNEQEPSAVGDSGLPRESELDRNAEAYLQFIDRL